MKKIILSAILLATVSINAQNGKVGIGNTDPKATLDVTGDVTNTGTADGIIVPRLTGDQLAAKDAVYLAAQTATQVYATAAATTPAGKTINVNAPGYYFFDGTVWQKVIFGLGASKWTNNNANTRVELTNLSNGTTARTAGTEFVVTDAGRVGIGVTAPLTTLEVRPTANPGGNVDAITLTNLSGIVANSEVSLCFAPSNLPGQQRSASISGLQEGGNLISLRLKTGDVGSFVERMKIDGRNGHVGIGVSTPFARLHVTRPSAPGTVITSTGSAAIFGTGTTFTSTFKNNDYFMVGNVRVRIVAITSDTSMVVDTNMPSSGTGLAYTPISGIFDMGNVGIGTTAPVNTLQVGTATVANTGGVRLPITSASTAQTGQPIGVDANGDIVRIASGTFDATVDFSVNANPNTGGTTSSPNTPASTTILYVSTIDGSQWTYNGTAYVAAPVSADWRVTGNAGTVQATNFVGTTDNIGLSFRTNNAIRQTITNTGNVGIGTTTPNSKLNVFGTINTGNAGIGDALNAYGIANDGGDTNNAFRIDAFANDLAILGTSGTGAAVGTSISFHTAPAASASSERIKILSNGNVGIGTTAPRTLLHANREINAVAQTTGGTGASAQYNTQLHLHNPSLTIGEGSGISFGVGGVGAVSNKIVSIRSNDFVDGHLAFFTKSTGVGPVNLDETVERMRITDAGNVGIGTNNPTGYVHTFGTLNPTRNRGFYSQHTTDEVVSTGFYFGNIVDLRTSATDATNKANIDGSFSRAHHQGTGTVSVLRGYNTNVFNTGSGIVTRATGATVNLSNQSSGIITDAVGLQILLSNAGTGSIGNGYGINIGTVDGTNKWSIYSSDPTAPSYFAGNVGIGTTAPISTLDVNGSFGANQISTDAATYSFTATDYAVRLTLAATQSVALPTIGSNSRRIVVLINPTAFDKVFSNNAYQDLNGGFSFTIPANSSLTLQNINGTGWALISKDLHKNRVATVFPPTASVTATGTTPATALDYMSITIPSAGEWEINWAVRGAMTTAITGIASVLTDNANVVQANSETLSVHSTTTGSMQGTGTGKYYVTTTGAATYKIRIYGVGGTDAFAHTDANGRSWVSAIRIN